MHSVLELTPTERQLLQALAGGVSNKVIAQHLGKSEFTVRNQLSRLFRKVNASNLPMPPWHMREFFRHTA